MRTFAKIIILACVAAICIGTVFDFAWSLEAGGGEITLAGVLRMSPLGIVGTTLMLTVAYSLMFDEVK